MITAQLSGGLGNQLFQISAAIALAWRNGDRATFDLGNHQRLGEGSSAETYRSTIFRNISPTADFIPTCEYFDPGKGQMPVYRQGIKIHGFFQSETYFKDFKPQIKELFRPNPDTLSHLRTKYSLDKSLGIHVRRGDYINYPFHFLPLSYYDRAIHLAEPHRQLVICSNDLDYCRQAFRGVNCIFSRERDELGDFYLLAACDQQIIANSTFSWWSSFLSDSTQLAIAPGQWQANQQGLIDIQLADHLRPI